MLNIAGNMKQERKKLEILQTRGKKITKKIRGNCSFFWLLEKAALG